MFKRLIATLFLMCVSFPAVAQACKEPRIWGKFLKVDPQTYEIRERINLSDDTQIVVLELGEIAGDYPKVFMFIRATKKCQEKVVSLGSYSYLQDKTKTSRLYHLDLYSSDQHVTLGFYSKLPPYEELREIAVKSLR